MKQSLIALLIGICLFIACKPIDTLPTDQVAIRPNESVKLGDLTIRIDTLRQAGCVRCLFAYNAFVSAVISNKTDQHRANLWLYDPTVSRLDSTGISLAGQTYKIILRDVTPHPDDAYSAAKSGDTKVIIQVTKR